MTTVVPDSVPRIGPTAPEFERTPPQDITAEQCVLGGMLLSKDAIADVVEVLRATDFYRPAHQTVFEAVLNLYGRGEPADPVTVAAELTRTGQIGRVGGAPYLHTVISSVPTAANAGYYAAIVAERAILRRLVEAGTRVVQLGYAGQGGDVDEIVDRAQAAVYEVTERRTSEDYVALEPLLHGTLEEIEAIGNRDGTMTGVPTGFADLDDLTNGLHPGQLVIVAARPGVGKSTLGLDVARAASIKSGLASVIFSLEMSRGEITMRLLSAEARVPLHHMRTGRMSDDDWARLARRMGEIADSPLFIDDSPNLTMMEIRAKARRLKQRHDLRLVVVDYMQLMTSHGRVESRQQEVSAISRAMKLLAKELDVPVIAISQLNRGPEQRNDKKPQLADLRESGCLTGDTRVWRADSGAQVCLAHLLATGERNIAVWTLGADLRLRRGTMTHVFASGHKPVFELELGSGRRVKASANHPFLGPAGWCRLDELRPGHRVAVPRRVPNPVRPLCWPTAALVLLAHLLGGGRSTRRGLLRYASADPANLRATETAAAHFGAQVRRAGRGRRQRLSARSPALAGWLRGLGLADRSAGEFFLPAEVAALPDREIALLLRHLWATDGATGAGAGQRSPATFSTRSRRLATDLQSLLLRLDLPSRLVASRGWLPVRYTVRIDGTEDAARFRAQVLAEPAARGEPDPDPAAGVLDTMPADVWARVQAVMAGRAATARLFQAALDIRRAPPEGTLAPPGRVRPARVAAALAEQDLDPSATGDVFWDDVVRVRSLGVQPVYDATVLGTHNFVADGVVVHNSLEQDADMVVLLYREDAFDRDSQRAGEADFIVAKHRNGPTKTISVAFQGHYSRFVDMSPA